MTEDRLLRVPDVAKRLDVSTYTVLAWLRSGRLKGYRPGGTRAGWRVRERDLEDFIERSANRQDGEE